MGSKSKPTKLQGPKGTRDLYPNEVLKRRYIQNAWRDASLRCGFDEIEGPTFESTELYSVKSGEGILGELFQAYSGKSPNEVEQVQETGRAPYALRPEFTPTLARMYAAKAKELPKPCKWFTAGPYFRAERPQRGRLREFLQWNVDVIGLPGEGDSPEAKAQMDAETIECCILACAAFGFVPKDLEVCINHRAISSEIAAISGALRVRLEDSLRLLDKIDKLKKEDFEYQARFNENINPNRMREFAHLIQSELNRLIDEMKSGGECRDFLAHYQNAFRSLNIDIPNDSQLGSVLRWVGNSMNLDWIDIRTSIVRGLAYYTGTVFEALADGERAVAGGGRYDNLIELMGGPPTPAVGFAMGDVVLGNLLEDKGLMPEGAELMEAAARPQASIRPEAFVVPNGDADNEALVHTLVANLRRGVENEDWRSRDDRKPWQSDRYSVRPLHARVSYKSTRNLGKLRADAEKQHARFFVEIHADNKVEITDMDKRESITSDTHGSFHVDPSAPNYVGKTLAMML